MDPTFVPGTGFVTNASINALALQADGKIIVGGSFPGYGSITSSNLVRINADGSVDATFGLGLGLRNNSTLNADVRGVAVQPDGRILVVGLFNRLDNLPVNMVTRLNASGQIDPTFIGFNNSSVDAVATLLNGGSVHHYVRSLGASTTTLGVTARLADGTTNTAFDASLGYTSSLTSGIGMFPIPPQIKMLLEQPDGKLLVTGRFTDVGGSERRHIARLNADGTVDTSFDAGLVQNNPTNVFGPGGVVHGVLRQPDGRLIIYGQFEEVGGIARRNIARLNLDGTLDTAFTPGIGALGNLNGGEILGADLQADGKIIVGGRFTNYNGTAVNRLARITSSGALDSSFNIGTGPGSTAGDAVHKIALQADGKVIVAGQFTTFNGVVRPGIVRLLGDTVVVIPAITSATTATAIVGQQFSYQITANHSPTSFGATGLPAGLTLNPANGLITGTPISAGTFTVGISATGASGSAAATIVLTVSPAVGAPVITQAPQNLRTPPGVSVTLSVGVFSPGPLTYQWRFNGVNIAGANTSTLTLNNVQPGNGGSYSVVVANAFGTVTSGAGTLEVLVVPTIIVQPAGQEKQSGDPVSFSVGATGSAPLTYQWRLNGTNLPGAATSLLGLPNVEVTAAGNYSVVVSNEAGTVVSSNALLVVHSAPVVVGPPAARIVTAASPVTFTVSALGDAPLVYQWRFNGTDLTGATGTTYSIGAATPAHEGLYAVVVSNRLGVVTSAAARLTVLPVSVSVPWAAAAGGSGPDVGNAIAVDAAGNSYVAGYFTGTASFGTNTLTSAGKTDLFVARFDSEGRLQWVRRAGSPGFDSAKGVAVDGGGNCYVTGAYEGLATFGSVVLTNTSPTSYADVFLAKYDAAGNVVWARSAGVEFANDEGTAVTVDRAGNVLVTGRSALDSFAGTAQVNSGRIFVAKYTGAGAEVWARKSGSYSGGNLDSGTGIASDDAGNVFVCGTFHSPVATFGSGAVTNFGGADVFLAKFDAAGSLQWARQAGGAGEDAAGAVAAAADGSAYLVGATAGSATFSGSNVTSLAGAVSDGFIAKYSGNGSMVWVRQMGGSGLSAARAVAVDAAGTVHMTGYFSGGATFGTTTLGGIAGSYDAFLARLDVAGNFAFAQQAGGADLSGDFGLGVGTDAAGNSFITGYFSGTSTVGGGSLPSRGAEDVLVARFSTSSPSPACRNSASSGWADWCGCAGRWPLPATCYRARPICSPPCGRMKRMC